MLRKHRLAAVCVASVMLGHTTSAVTPAAFPPGHRFEPSPCPFTPAADQVEGGTLSCGFVVVPENRTRPEGNAIRLAVAIFKSSTAATRPPLFLLGGGPGTFTLDTFGPIISGPLSRDFTAGRDLVIFDQRGVGYSQPALNCQELDDLALRTLGIHRTRDQETDDQVEAAFACRDRLIASGIELDAYNTAASAADVNDVRIALGYGMLDLWGISLPEQTTGSIEPAGVTTARGSPPSRDQCVRHQARSASGPPSRKGSCASTR